MTSRAKNEVTCRVIERKKEKTKNEQRRQRSIRERLRGRWYNIIKVRQSSTKKAGLINRSKVAGWSRRMRTEKRPLVVMRAESVLLN